MKEKIIPKIIEDYVYDEDIEKFVFEINRRYFDLINAGLIKKPFRNKR